MADTHNPPFRGTFVLVSLGRRITKNDSLSAEFAIFPSHLIWKIGNGIWNMVAVALDGAFQRRGNWYREWPGEQ
jgi:hypothetical protein